MLIKSDGIFSRLSNLLIELFKLSPHEPAKHGKQNRTEIKLVGLHNFLFFLNSSNMVTLVFQKQLR